MKKVLTITSGIAAAMLATACGPNPEDEANKKGWQASEDTAYCTDRQGKRVDDDLCDDDDGNGGGGGAFMMMYMARGGHVPPYGHSSRYAHRRPQLGRSYSPSKSSFYSSPTAVRGGFGGSSSSYGSASS